MTAASEPQRQVPHTAPLELYHHPESLCSQKVRVALVEKGLDYTSHVIELSDLSTAGTNLTPDYLAINPHGIVPTLVHEGRCVYDSWAIIEHLDTTWPYSGERLWPTDPGERGRMQEWLEESSLRNEVPIGASMGTAAAGLSAPWLRQALKAQPLLHVIGKFWNHPMPERGWGFIAARIVGIPHGLVKKSAVSMAAGLVRLDRALAHGGPWLLGDFRQIDITMMAILHRLDDMGLGAAVESDVIPHVAPYRARLRSRDSYQRAILDFHHPPVRALMAATFPEGNPWLAVLQQEIERAARA